MPPNLGPVTGKLIGAIGKAMTFKGKRRVDSAGQQVAKGAKDALGGALAKNSLTKDLSVTDKDQYKKGNWEENTPYTSDIADPMISNRDLSGAGRIAGKGGMTIDSSGKATVPKPPKP